ncbi:restriction endonuclease subunit S [Aliarcobacter butzleri]|uniref:restriction endonuclease subunit S n=1 Tax=Aliarcobacter butzleri TaxID=28197 RepID=UPI003AFA9FB1
MINNLPNGWKVEELGNMNLDISDGNYSSLYPTQNEFIEKGIPFIRANNISKNTIIDEDMRFVSEDKHAILKKGQLKQNDLLFTNRGIIGQVGIVPDKYIGANINAQIVRINSGNKFTNKYLMYCFLKQELKNQMTKLETGSTLKQLPIRQLKKLNIPIPPLEQQKKIVKVLDLTSNLIEKQKELLKKYDLFLKSKFIEMFGDPILNPMGWEVKKLKDLSTLIMSGNTPKGGSEVYVDKGILFLEAKMFGRTKFY